MGVKGTVSLGAPYFELACLAEQLGRGSGALGEGSQEADDVGSA